MHGPGSQDGADGQRQGAQDEEGRLYHSQQGVDTEVVPSVGGEEGGREGGREGGERGREGREGREWGGERRGGREKERESWNHSPTLCKTHATHTLESAESFPTAALSALLNSASQK